MSQDSSKDKHIQKHIDDAVRVYRESLEKTYLETNKPFYGSGFHLLTNLFVGKVSMTRKANGNMRISGELPKIMFKDDCNGLPRNLGDWKILPVVVTWFQEDVAEAD